MAKIKNKKNIFILKYSSIFVLCTICISLWIYFFKPVLLFRLYEFGLNTRAYAKYYFNPYPSNEWVYCDRIEDIRKYLENEKVKNISFYYYDHGNPPDKREICDEVADSDNINLTLKLIYAGRIDGYIGSLFSGRIKFITDKHKFTMPFDWEEKDICSYRWRSVELRKKLWEWGVGPENKYIIPSKEDVVAILLYNRYFNIKEPLAIFYDKESIDEVFCMCGINKMKENVIFVSKNTGTIFYPRKRFEGHEWLEKIIDAYEFALKKANEREKYFPEDINSPAGSIEFVTRDGSYGKDICIDANTVFDDYIKSEQLKKYFDELGLTEELLESNTKDK